LELCSIMRPIDIYVVVVHCYNVYLIPSRGQMWQLRWPLFNAYIFFRLLSNLFQYKR
jgi:hypothetical protein